MKPEISPIYLNTKFIGYLCLTITYYYLINFVFFDVFTLALGQHAVILGLNVGVCILFTLASNSKKMSFEDSFDEPTNEKRAKHISILAACIWVMYYEEIVLQIHFSKLTGLALLMTYPSISYFLSKDQTVDTLDDGKSFFENNPKNAKLHAVLWILIVLGSISLFFFGEWVLPLK